MRAFGQATTTATTEVPVNGTTYNEQSSGAQRSLKSASANDTAAGTGARTVRVTYFTLSALGAIAGPFTEVVTLNGTNAVAMVATDLALVERMEVLTAGSGGVAAGAVTLYAAADGTGTAIAAIASGGVRALLAHHYVASGKQCRLTDLFVTGGDAAQALFTLKSKAYPSGIEQPVAGTVGSAAGGALQLLMPDLQKSPILGPARVRVMVAPANTNSQTSYASFGWADEQVSFS